MMFFDWPLFAGVLLGILFFGGLRLTLVQLPTSSSPGLLVLLSFLARFGVAFAVFYAAIRWEGWGGALMCLVGFLAVRFAFVRNSRDAGEVAS